MVTSDEQIGERAGHEQAMRVLVQSSVTDLDEAEHPLDDEKRVFDFGPHLRLGPVFGSLDVVHDTVMPGAPIGEILGLRRVFDDHISLAAIGLVAPHPGFLAVQQIGQKMTIGDIGRGRRRRMDDLGFAIDPDMRLHAEIPLVPLAGLVHVGIARLIGVLRRGRCMDDRGIDDRAGRHFQPIRLKMPMHLLEQTAAEIIGLEQMPETAHVVSSGTGSRPRSMPTKLRIVDAS